MAFSRVGAAAVLTALIGSSVAQAQVVISQASGAGGFGGSAPNVDFVELFNRGTMPQDLTGWSVQCSWNGTTVAWVVIPLPGFVLQPGQYFLVQCYSPAGAGGTIIPTPDYIFSGTSTTILFSNEGTVALCNDTVQLANTPCPATAPSVQDFVRWGGTNACFDGSAPAAVTNTPGYTIFRLNGGCTDTNDNFADFTTNGNAICTPRNTSSPLGGTGGVFVSASAAPNPVNAGNVTIISASFQGCSGPAPTITSATADLTAFGMSATQALSGGPTTWTYNLAVSGSQATAIYTIPVQGTDGSTTYNGSASLRVLGPPPASDTCAGAINLTLPSGSPVPFAVDNTTSTADGIDIGTCNTTSTDTASVWFRYDAAEAGSVQLNETSAQNIATGVWEMDTAGAACPSAGPATVCNATEAFSFQVQAGKTYYILMQNDATAQPTAALAGTFTFVPPAVNDECATALTATLGLQVGTNINATQSVALTNVAGNIYCTQTTWAVGTPNNQKDVYWSFTAPATADYVIDTCGSSFDTIMSVHGACPADQGNLVTCNDDSTSGAGNTACSDGGTRSRIPHVTLTAGSTYYIRIFGYNNTTGTINLSIAYVGTVGSCCNSTDCTLTDAANCTGTYTDGGTCASNPCGGATGVCCRGATCDTTVTDAGACTASLVPGQKAGAAFVTDSSICNSGAISNTPCCYANYNKANGVNVQDIFDFLSDWFAGGSYARVGSNGTAGPLAVQNIFDFLSDWFTGGCS